MQSRPAAFSALQKATARSRDRPEKVVRYRVEPLDEVTSVTRFWAPDAY